MKASTIVKHLKERNQDFEWYPTTTEQLDVIKDDILNRFHRQNNRYYNDDKGIQASILDVGAGNGSSLEYLTDGKKFAIEKSEFLIGRMPNDIFVIGTDFDQQTLYTKNVDIIFSNPPYSMFERWVEKILMETQTAFNYFVIPERWKISSKIKQILELRDMQGVWLASSTFEDAEREARAKVDIVLFTSKPRIIANKEFNSYSVGDSFKSWLKSNFTVNDQKKSTLSERIDEYFNKSQTKNEIIQRIDEVEFLVNDYHSQVDKLMNNAKSICEFDSDIIGEFGITQDVIIEKIKQKIESLNGEYWKRVFQYTDILNQRITSEYREILKNELLNNTNVDFTIDNIKAVMAYCIKNTNNYIDEQFVQYYESFLSQANIELYKSNKRLLQDDEWQYGRTPENLTKIKLENRLVRTSSGLTQHWLDGTYELSERAINIIKDTKIIANNFGFDISETLDYDDESFEWESGKSNMFYFKHNGKHEKFMEVKVFKNGNMHIKINQYLIMKMNVEFGRLKGWLKSNSDIHNDLNIDYDVMKKFGIDIDNKDKLLYNFSNETALLNYK